MITDNDKVLTSCRVVGCNRRQASAVILKTDIFEVDVLVCDNHFAQWVMKAHELGLLDDPR